MDHSELIVSNNLLNEFRTCTQRQYNGKLTIQDAKGHRWTFYYRLGRIVWATGGIHPLRRWRRHMIQHCPQIEVDKMQLRHEDIAIDYWDYRRLLILHEKQTLKREQIKVIVENTIAELLFDIAQQSSFVTVKCERDQQVILEAPINFTNADVSLKLMEDSWKLWSDAGLANVFPDSAPVLRKPEQLRQQVSSNVYKNFLTFINGKFTLRDLAVKMKQNPLLVARSLLPYIHKGIIELLETPDLPVKFSQVKSNSSNCQPTAPLVACVDDSLQVCQIMEDILTSHGFRCIKILDPVQALPMLIQHKPDLIFLDLIMPIASGYEICSQLRRISTFADVPVIILTGCDALVDRVRAKVVGSTDFVAKPVDADKVISIVHKYLKMKSPAKITSDKLAVSYGH